jgi:hypothetical protein
MLVRTVGSKPRCCPSQCFIQDYFIHHARDSCRSVHSRQPLSGYRTFSGVVNMQEPQMNLTVLRSTTLAVSRLHRIFRAWK